MPCILVIATSLGLSVFGTDIAKSSVNNSASSVISSSADNSRSLNYMLPSVLFFSISPGWSFSFDFLGRLGNIADCNVWHICLF